MTPNPTRTLRNAFQNPKILTASIPVPVPVTNTYTNTFNITLNATAPATTPTDAQRPSSACVDPEARVTVMGFQKRNGCGRAKRELRDPAAIIASHTSKPDDTNAEENVA